MDHTWPRLLVSPVPYRYWISVPPDRSALDMPPCRMRRRSFVPCAVGSFARTFHAITVLGEKPHERPGSSACNWCTDTARCSRAAPEPGANEARRRKPGGLRYVHDTEPGGRHALLKESVVHSGHIGDSSFPREISRHSRPLRNREDCLSFDPYSLLSVDQTRTSIPE
jgi:hypothetical protein